MSTVRWCDAHPDDTPEEIRGLTPLPLATPFETPEWFGFTGGWWNWDCAANKGKRDHDGEKIGHRYKEKTKKFALKGGVTGHEAGKLRRFPAGWKTGTGCVHDKRLQPALMCHPDFLFTVLEGDDWKRFLEHGLALRGNVRSGSGRGLHCYMAIHPDLAHLVPRHGPIPGGDFIANLYVPAPGTVHPTGGTYDLIDPVINVIEGAEGAAILARIGELRRQWQREHPEGHGGGEGGREGGAGDGNEPACYRLVTTMGGSKEEIRAAFDALVAAQIDGAGPGYGWDAEEADERFGHYWEVRAGRETQTGGGSCLRRSCVECKTVVGEAGKPPAIHCIRGSSCGNVLRAYEAERDPWEIKLKLIAEAAKHEKREDWTHGDHGCPPSAWELYLDIADVRMDLRVPRRTDDWVTARDPAGTALRWLAGMHLVIVDPDGSLDVTGFPQVVADKSAERMRPGWGAAMAAHMDAGGEWRAAKIEGGSWTDAAELDAQVLKAHEALSGEAGARGETGRLTLARYCRAIQPYAIAHGRNGVTESQVCRSRKRLLEAGKIHEDKPGETYVSDHEWTRIPATYAPGPETDPGRRMLMAHWDTASLTLAESCERGWCAALHGLGIDPRTEVRSRPRLDELREAWLKVRKAAFLAEREAVKWARTAPRRRAGARGGKGKAG
jgi:hypothetical protein